MDGAELTSGTRDPSRTQSVARAAVVLHHIASAGPAGATELAHVLGVRPSTAFRIARTLCDAGLLARDDQSERYHLGPALIPLGRAAEARSGYDLLAPLMEELAGIVGESVNLGVRQGNLVFIVSRITSTQRLRVDEEPGTTIAIHASAMGKCLLAFARPDEVPPRELARFTSRTIVDRDELARALAEIRRRGWALNDEERDIGARAVAAPVLDADGRAVAALAVQGPTVRLPDDALEDIARLVIDRAGQMARLLAGR